MNMLLAIMLGTAYASDPWEDYAAGRYLEVLPAQRVFDIRRREAVGSQSLGIEPDTHRIASFAEDAHISRTGQRLQARLRNPAHHIRDLERRYLVAVETQPDHRIGIGIHLGHHRFVNPLGQPCTHPRDPVAHIGRCTIRVAVKPKSRGDLTGFRP